MKKDERKDTVLPALFSSITVPSELNNDGLAYWGGWTGALDADGKYVFDEDLKVEIVVVAHAIQKDGLGTATEAWEAFDQQKK